MPNAGKMSYTIALIGCGRVGVWLEDDPLRAKPASHMGGIKKIIANGSEEHGLQPVAVCDIDEDRLHRCMSQWNIPKGYSDYKELIDTENPDLLCIATWTESHRDIAIYAAQNGVKGIVLEKPMALNIDQAQEIIRSCTVHNVKLVINHERRWDPKYKAVKKVVSDQTLGQLKAVYGNVLCRSAPRGSWKSVLQDVGGGPLLHDGTHLVDMVLYLAGNISTVNGSVKREDPEIGVETTATAMMTTTEGIPVFIEAGGMRDYFNFELDLHFEKGRLKVGNGIKEFYISEESTRYSGFRDLVEAPFPSYVRDSDPFTGAIQEVIKAIDQNKEPFSSGKDGLRTMEVIFGIYYSAYLKGKTVSLPLKLSGHPLEKMFKTGML